LAKRKVLSAAEVSDILYAHGFRHVRTKGSHFTMQKRTAQGTITIPIPNHDPLATGTLASIIRQSGLPKTLFEVD
jgi:predicted RNA binding protein YcfA (HicA-like mRNA interferase family)